MRPYAHNSVVYRTSEWTPKRAGYSVADQFRLNVLEFARTSSGLLSRLSLGNGLDSAILLFVLCLSIFVYDICMSLYFTSFLYFPVSLSCNFSLFPYLSILQFFSTSLTLYCLLYLSNSISTFLPFPLPLYLSISLSLPFRARTNRSQNIRAGTFRHEFAEGPSICIHAAVR